MPHQNGRGIFPFPQFQGPYVPIGTVAQLRKPHLGDVLLFPRGLKMLCIKFHDHSHHPFLAYSIYESAAPDEEPQFRVVKNFCDFVVICRILSNGVEIYRNRSPASDPVPPFSARCRAFRCLVVYSGNIRVPIKSISLQKTAHCIKNTVCCHVILPLDPSCRRSCAFPLPLRSREAPG